MFTFTEVDGNTLQLKADTGNKLLNRISLNLDYEIFLLLLGSFLPVNPHSVSTYGKGIDRRFTFTFSNIVLCYPLKSVKYK